MIKKSKYSFRLILSNTRIKKYIDLLTNTAIKKFTHPLTSNQYKIYVIKSKEEVLYIGTTKSSIKSRLRAGLLAKGKNGYHGYKWKDYNSVILIIWCFEELNKPQIENIEAELAFTIRQKTGNWPICQNEIHFNNSFIPDGRLIAKEIYKELKMKEN